MKECQGSWNWRKVEIEKFSKIENEEGEKDNELKKMNNGRRGEIWKGIRKDNNLKERGEGKGHGSVRNL